MIQELLLFGQVPAENHDTLRQQLAGLARMQPQPVLEIHLIFRPLPPQGLSNIPTGSGTQGAQQQEMQKTRQLLNAPLTYIQLVGVVEKRDLDWQIDDQVNLTRRVEDHGNVMIDNMNRSKHSQRAIHWYLDFKDIPEPGKMSTTSRATSKTQILDGDPIQFLQNLGYE